MAEIDWLSHMLQHAQTTPEVFDGRLGEEWIIRECETAKEIAFTECPDAEYRYEQGDLSENLLAYVVCQMVLRVIRYTPLQGESNGSYTYDRKDDQSNPPSYDASPNLYVSKAEKELLNGKDSSRRKIGSVGMGLHRVYGM